MGRDDGIAAVVGPETDADQNGGEGQTDRNCLCPTHANPSPTQPGPSIPTK
jgi:hypothetical protein